MNRGALKIVSVAVALVVMGTVLAISIRVGRSRGDSVISPTEARFAGKQRLILWAWERPTDLSYIDPNRVSVAFLAKTIRLMSDKVTVRPRLQPLKLAGSTPVIAVARVESDRNRMPRLSANQIEQTSRAIVRMAEMENVSEVQIDFDARQSERQFYRELIIDVRRQLPDHVRLSMTALASWCMSDDWISGLPVDEAVPMLFRMAADGKYVRNGLDRGEDFSLGLCRHSYGVSLDEPWPVLVASRRLFIFNPEAWSKDSVQQIMEPAQ